VRTFLITPISQFISLAFPMSGPYYAFKGFPWRMPNAPAHVLHMTAPPNCMPSDHITMALLILYFSWRWYPARLLAAAYLLLIVLSTLGSGEHYMIDLIAAVPFTCLVIYLGGVNREHARRAVQTVDHDYGALEPRAEQKEYGF
jgi:membrane-associated phospholipid phosphatase